MAENRLRHLVDKGKISRRTFLHMTGLAALGAVAVGSGLAVTQPGKPAEGASIKAGHWY